MTPAQFVSEIEGCFGAYPQAYKKYIAAWLVNLEGDQLQKVFDRVVTTYSSRWGKPPGIPEFDAARRAVRVVEIDRKVAELEKGRQAALPAPEVVNKDLADPAEVKRFMDEFRARAGKGVDDGSQ